jgi:hypothetical protein
VGSRKAGVDEDPDLLEGAGACLAMGMDGYAGPRMGGGGRPENRNVARGRAAQAATDFDDPGSDVGPADDRPAIVPLVDPVVDVRDEQVGKLVLGRAQAPVRWTVEPLVWRPVAATTRTPLRRDSSASLAGLRPQSAGMASIAVRRPAAAAPVSSAARRSTSARRKSADSSTGRPPSMIRCSCA